MVSDLPPPPVIVCVAAAEQAGRSALDEIRDARLRGDYDGARAEIRSVLTSTPNDADVWLELGLVSLASGDAANAHAAFLRALEIAPDYDDAKLGLARLAYRQGDLAQARTWFSSISSSRHDDADVEAMRQLLLPRSSTTSAWRLDMVGAYSSLSNSLAPWREAMVTLSQRSGTRMFGASFDYNDRFGSTDIYGELIAAQATRAGTWEVALGGAPDADFAPQAAARVAFVGKEHRHWSVEAGLSLARYNAGNVESLRVGLTRSLGDWRAQARGIVVHDEADRTRSGYEVGVVWGGDEAPQISLSYTQAPESSEGVTVDVQSVAAGVAFNVSDRVRVHIGGVWEERDAFDRSELSLALTRTF